MPLVVHAKPSEVGAWGGMEVAKDAALNREAQALSNKKASMEIGEAEQALESYNRMLEIANRDIKHAQGEHAELDGVEATKIYANAALKAGRPKDFLELTKGAYEIEAKSVEIASKKLDNQEKVLQGMADALGSGNIQTPEQWQQYLKYQQMLHPEAAQNPQSAQMYQQLMEMDFNPEIAEQIRNNALSQLEQIQIQKERAMRDKYRMDTAMTQAELAYLPEKRRMEQEYHRARVKELGDEQTARQDMIKTSEINYIKDRLAAEFPGEDPNKLKIPATAIAERMMDLMKNAGAPRSEAARIAIQEAKDDPTAPLGGFSKYMGMPGGSKTEPMVLTRKDIRNKNFRFEPNKFYFIDNKVILATSPTEWKQVELTQEELDNLQLGEE